MIKVMKPGGGIYAPVIVCDFCSKPIEDGKGNFLWNPDTEDDITEIYFSHKGCDHSLEHALHERGITTMWMDLDLFMLWLENNTKLDMKKARESHKAMKELGLVT
jgi:ribosomal protein L24E